MRIFEIHPHLRKYNLLKIGFCGNTLYISPNRLDCIEVWSLHSYIPNSWRKILSYPLIQVFYSYYAVCENDRFIYCLIVALFVSYINIIF